MIKSYQPHVNKDGSIKDTPMLSVVKLKENSRVMITYNIDLSDGIVNGSLGTVREFVYHGPENSVQTILVEFYDTETGRKAWQCANQQDNLTSVTIISFEYAVGRKTVQNSTKVKVIQFSLKLAWAVTLHKFQGQTIAKPTRLVGHMERIH
jgi:ATP-dependent exoDNAse (exonuclease V) alpha subunit